MSVLVSIIIPYYNKKDTIHRSVDSILDQTYTNWELIIIDDFGQDRLEVGTLPKDERIKIYFNDANLGAGRTRQKGQEYAKGEYIAFLDADDWWDVRFLNTCLKRLINKSDCAGAYVKSLILKEEGLSHERQYSDLGLTQIRETLIKYARPWQTGGILWKYEFCGDWGTLKTNEDSWFEFKASTKANKLAFINETLYYVDATGSQHLSNNIGSKQSVLDRQNLFLMVYTDFWNTLSLKYKILLYHRLVRGQLKIHQYCPLEAREMGSKLNMLNKWIFAFHQNPIILKIIHKILQKSPYKIYF